MIADPAVKNRVMIDIMNEPDARGLRRATRVCLACEPCSRSVHA